MRKLFTSILLVFFSMLALSANQLVDFKIEPVDHNQASFIFETKRPIDYKHFVLSAPDRLVIDFSNMDLANTSLKPKGKCLVNAIRTHVSTKKTRIVFDLTPNVASKVELLAGKHGTKTRVKVQLMQLKTARTKSAFLAKARSHVTQAKQKVVKATDAARKVVASKVSAMRDNVLVKPKVGLPNVENLRDIVVVIDPGHGGKDPGATGRHKHREKSVVLAISQRLKKAIDEEPGFKALLTRKADYFLSLRHRMRIAREDKADMFIAIHADAYKNKQAHGASVFAVSERGATSEAARWLAERENRSELIGGVKLSDKENVLRSVLIDLSQTATTGASLEVGHDILHQMGLIGHLHHGEVEQAAFVVLKAPDIPSVLVETGFLSNSREERLLTSHHYQTKLANAIHQGIRDYFYRRSPRGTVVSALKQGMIRHRVAMGESLSGIAREYHTSVASLQRLNKVNGTKILIGQELKIPKV